jgi:orotate phosphoribosyltransferase
MVKDGNIVKGLYDTGAVKFRDKDPFIYVARKIGPVYVNAADLARDKGVWKTAVQDVGAMINEVVTKDIDVISGGLTRDVMFSIAVAHDLNVRPLIFRKEEKTYGAGGGMEGVIKEGDYVVHIADLLTEAKSALKWINAIRDNKGTIEHYFTVFDRCQGGLEALAKEGVTAHSLAQMNEGFFKEGVTLGSITQETMDATLDYLKRPAEWAKEFLRANPQYIVNHITNKDGVIVVKLEEKKGANGKVEKHLVEPAGLAVIVEGYPELREELWDQVEKLAKESGKFKSGFLTDAVDGNGESVVLNFSTSNV